MSKLSKITLNFDINTSKVVESLKENNFSSIRKNKGHDDLYTYLTKNGFEHAEQESSYISIKPMSLKQAQAIVEGIHNNKELSYLGGCFDSVSITRVNNRVYDLTKLASSNESLKILTPAKSKELSKYCIEPDDKNLSGKQLRFDFNTQKLSEIGAESKAYSDINEFLLGKNFDKTQRSVYTIDEKVSDTHIIKDVMSFFDEHQDYKYALKSIQISSIGKIRDITKIANNEAVEIGKVKTVSKTRIVLKI